MLYAYGARGYIYIECLLNTYTYVTRKNDMTMNVMAGCGGYPYVICINPYHKSYDGEVYLNAYIYLDPIHYKILSY